MQSGRFFLVSFLFFAGLNTWAPAKAVAYDFKPLETVVKKAVSDSVFPGASLAVLYKGMVVFHKAFGKLTYDPHSSPADTSTMYDLASLTKAVSSTSIAMQLVERDSLSLQVPVSKYLPTFTGKGKDKITIEQLMRHTSGLRAHILFSKTCTTPEQLFSTIASDTLISKPGTTTLYSDLGFILLGKIIETITGKTLNTNFHNRFAEPLGMTSSMFTPPQSFVWRIAPVEKDTLWPFPFQRPLVHDQNAALLGGVAGHAGLYATTGDLIKLVSMLMNGGTVNNHTYIHAATLNRFLAHKGSERALGWDVPSPGGHSSAGDYYSKTSYGHLGYTGTSIWIDPEKELAVIFLSNRVYPSSDNIKIRSFRPVLHNTIASCLGLKKAVEKVH
ncbi:MAG: serine hydrolase [Chlorobiales bacterium]|nr:serine hydrolase [Chlorobiales bacterium]